MYEFSKIEEEFLKIEPLNSIELNNFSKKYNEILLGLLSDENPNKQLIIKMLIEIACSNSFSENHKVAINLFNKIKPYLETNQVDHFQTNQIYFCLANSNFALKKYRQALIFFKKIEPTGHEKISNDKLIAICKTKIINNILLNPAYLGIFLLIFDYSIKWLFSNYYNSTISSIGVIGAVCLIPYVIHLNLKK
jgi:hypothetical protein